MVVLTCPVNSRHLPAFISGYASQRIIHFFVQKKRGYENIIHFWQHEKGYTFAIQKLPPTTSSCFQKQTIFASFHLSLKICVHYSTKSSYLSTHLSTTLRCSKDQKFSSNKLSYDLVKILCLIKYSMPIILIHMQLTARNFSRKFSGYLATNYLILLLRPSYD